MSSSSQTRCQLQQWILVSLLLWSIFSIHSCGKKDSIRAQDERSEDAATPQEKQPDTSQQPSIFRKENLVAWALVPFDSKKRTPTQRAAMLKRVGFSRFAYDWRDIHVPEFEQEILALQKQNIQYFAFWGLHQDISALFVKHKITPQIWWFSPSPTGTQEERVTQATTMILPHVKTAAKLGSTLGLYNHLGWGGEPENMVAVVQRIRNTHGLNNIGIVYNFHHGHEHINDFARLLALMKPYLLCVNLNGMNEKAKPKILTIGKGQHEARMIQILRDSGFRGAIGIIAHQETRDAEIVLQENIDGLKKILKQQNDRDAYQSYP